MGTHMIFKRLFLDFWSSSGAGTLNKDNIELVFPSAM